MISILDPLVIGGIIFLVLLSTIKIVKQYERGVKFTLGKYSGIMSPGINFIIPLVQTFERVDIRQMTINLQPQSVMTSDKVSLKIDGVVFFRVSEPEKVILNVENLLEQLEGKATSELKEIMGSLTMTESLSKREYIATKLKQKLEDAVKDKGDRMDWGIIIKAVQINNLILPDELVRAMSKQAEAEREKEARITKADGEFQASKKFSEASKFYKGNPDAIRLRELQTYQEIGTEHNTLMMVIPSTMAVGDGKWLLPFLDKADKKK